MEEMTLQAARFIDALTLQGESLELTLESIQNEKGRLLPLRSKSMLATSPVAEDPEIRKVLKTAIQSCPHGAWVSLNPIRKQIAGKAPGDADVTSFRYTLIEADELTKEEQWEKIRRLNLPVKSVVWSGGKSLHVIVKIEAETDRKLYDARVKALHEYLDRKEFPYDKANRNPSRLTRLPGFYRENDLQYLAAGEFGPKSWEEFEALYLTSEKHDKRKASSPLNGLLGGRPKTPVTEYAEAFLAEYQTTDKLLTLRYWDSTWYLYGADSWITLTTEEMKMRITGFLQRENVQAQERISQSLVNDILVNLQSDHFCGLPASKYRMPCWLPNGENADAWMSFRNGVLNLKSLIENPDSAPEFHPNTPRFFSRHRVAYAFDPAAECPLWQEYLNTTFDSEEMRRAFQMLFGYILSGETRLNAGFFWIGQGGDGKSTGAHILRELVGSDNSCCLPFGNLKDKFSSVLLTENKLNLV